MSVMESQTTGVSSVCLAFIYTNAKEYIKASVTGLCEGNPPVIGRFPTQRASNEETVSISATEYGNGISKRSYWLSFNEQALKYGMLHKCL